MFLNGERNKIDKIILSDENIYDAPQSDPSVIDVKITSKEQVYSKYSYSVDKLNSEFSEYVFEKAKGVPIKHDITIKIHSTENIDAIEIEQTLKKHYRTAYKEAKKEIKRISLISLVMTLLGILALTALILFNHFTNNLYIISIVEIAAWVFVWEAIDYFFLQRPVVKAKCVLIQRIYMSKIEIDNNKTTN